LITVGGRSSTLWSTDAMTPPKYLRDLSTNLLKIFLIFVSSVGSHKVFFTLL
jgi:hypothetical protein